MFSYKVLHQDGNARVGIFKTAHGEIKTPVFMPVGTLAGMKGIDIDTLKDMNAEIMLSNTYHLYLRPGHELIADFGGLHKFMSADIPVLTDSGGFQVFSLGRVNNDRGGFINKESLVKIREDHVEFRSHLDGSKHIFSPESVMRVQSNLGGDIIMAFDECAPGDSTAYYAKRAMDRTHRWAVRCLKEYQDIQQERIDKNIYPQALFPIIQGVVYPELRRESVRFLRDLPTKGIAIGGLSVGESKKDMYETLDVLAPDLPADRPHYLMGVGSPEDLVEAIERGVDMFDCVLPTRLGRHGVVFSAKGRMKLTNEKYKNSQDKIPCFPGYETKVAQKYSLGYLRHMIHSGEMLGQQLLSMHNVDFLIQLTHQARIAIEEGKYSEFKRAFYENYTV